MLYRPYLARYPTLPVSAFAMLASVGFLAALAAPEGFFAAPPRFSPAGWLAVGFIGAGSGIGYYLWLWALRHASATEVTVFLALSPITAAWLGALWLGERTSVASVLGLALVAVGLWLAHRETKGNSRRRYPRHETSSLPQSATPAPSTNPARRSRSTLSRRSRAPTEADGGPVSSLGSSSERNAHAARARRRVQLRGGARRQPARRTCWYVEPAVEGANEADRPLSSLELGHDLGGEEVE